MMPWWSWLLIWGGLTIVLFGMLAVMLWRLLLRGSAAAEELGALAAMVEILDASTERKADEKFQPAILEKLSAVEWRRHRARVAAVERRESRRQLRMARGRALLQVDPLSRRWFPGL